MLGGSSSSSSSSSSSKTPFFPSLSYLSIMFCPNLKGWRRNSDDDDDDDDNEPHHLLLPSFPPCLSMLEIINCPNLISMPNLTSLKEPYIGGCPKFRYASIHLSFIIPNSKSSTGFFRVFIF